MTGVRIFLRRLRAILWTALTLLTVLAAILVGVGKLLMPYSDRYQPQLEEWLSREFQRPVKIESFTGEWKAFGPRISLRGVTFPGLGDAAGEIAIQRAALDVKPLNGLLPGRPLYSFHIIGADLALIHLPDGRWELSGLGVSGRGSAEEGSGMGVLATVGELRLEDSVLSFSDRGRQISAQFSEVNGRVQLNGSEISAEIQANVTGAENRRVLGDLKATLVMSLDRDQRLVGAQWHAKTGELMIAELVRQMPPHPLIPEDGWLNAELWGTWEPASGQQMEGVLDLRDSHLAGEDEVTRVDHLNARFRWAYMARKTWRLDFSEFRIDQGGQEWGTDRLSLERNIPGNLGLWVSADAMDVGFPLELTQRIMSVYQTPWPRNVPRRAVGRIMGFDLVLDSRWKLYLARGRFEDAEAWEWDRWPSVAGVHGRVNLQAGSGEVEVGGQDVAVDWPRNFRRALVLDIPACTLDIGWGRSWQVDAHDCAVENDVFAASGRLRFAKSEGKPSVDINALIQRADMAELDDYWPRSVLKPKVTEWLSRGLVSGAVTSGRFVLRGDMDDWPFLGSQGQLEAELDFQDADLDYYPGWPRALRMDGTARFRGVAMEVEAQVGSLAGVPVRRIRGTIDNFRAPVLALEYATGTTLPGLLGFIRQSPLLENAQLDPEQFQFTGEARIDGLLRVPLKPNGERLGLSGTLELPGNGFTELRSAFSLEQVRGTLAYDRDGLRADLLNARYRGHETTIGLEAGWAGGASFRTVLQGKLPIREVIPQDVLDGEPLLNQINGSAQLTAKLELEPAQDQAPSEIWLEISSDLVGVEIGYPEPLSKPPAASWPSLIRYPLRAADPVCTIQIPGRLTMAFDIPGEFGAPRRASFRLGAGPAAMPDPGFLRIAGSVDRLDVDRWIEGLRDRFSQAPEIGRLELEQVNLRSKRLFLLGREFADVDVEVAYETGLLTGHFDSESLAGGVRYSRSDDGSHSLSAQLDRLRMPPPPEGASRVETDPTLLPEMHIYIEAFSYLGLDLGETRIEAYPRQDGFRFASIEANSPDFTLNARGDWVKDASGQRSDFDIVMTSESLGSLIHALDISSVLEGGQTMLHYDASWPGPPAEFALARLNGNISFSVIQGTLVNADAGAGRMVGLMSIAALPRRLAFDFRDVFGSGFIFDEANGTITLENGTAHTDDLVLKSTAATMEIVGSSQLEEQTFDYILSIKPGVGQTLPVLGAIAAGPGGAAAGLALQGLLQKSLGEAAEARYSITGAWSEPQVVRIPLEPEAEAETVNE